jgi:electron transfer flavoprotein alpha subunit
MKALIIVEHDNQSVKPSTHTTITAAKKITSDITLLVAGHGIQNVTTSASKIDGVTKVLVADQAHYENPMAEDLTALIEPIAKQYTHIFAPATTFGKNLLPRLGALLDVQPISDIMEVISDKSFKRPIYAGNAIATVESSDAIIVATVRSTAFDKAADGNNTAEIEIMQGVASTEQSKFISQELSKSERPELTSANVVISGGRGLQNGDNFKMLEDLADRLDAAIGASRAAVDAGYVPNDYQVGQTGKVVAPDLYIAIGISGAIQHLAGMKDSKIIVAINKDEEAPIFQIADYGIVGDLFDIVPELCSELDKIGIKSASQG